MKVEGYTEQCRYPAEWIVTPYIRDLRDNVAGIDTPVCSVHLMAVVTEMMNDGLKRFAGYVVRRSDVPAIGSRREIGR